MESNLLTVPDANAYLWPNPSQPPQQPESESRRREAINAILKKQFEVWQREERTTWLPPSDSRTDSHLTKKSQKSGAAERHASKNLLLLLNMVRPYAHTALDFNTWLDDQRRYALHILDVAPDRRRLQYCMPLVYLARTASDDYNSNNNNNDLQDLDVASVTKQIPSAHPQNLLRVIQFPQTRHLFLDDEIFRGLYPKSTPDRTIQKISFNFRQKVLNGTGFYNSLTAPFFDDHSTLDLGNSFSCGFPIVEFESLHDYASRKHAERAAINYKGEIDDLPLISQWKYCRRMDLMQDTTTQLRFYHPAGSGPLVHSGRGINEYQFPAFKTLKLDQDQSVIAQQQVSTAGHPAQLLTVNCLWMICFPAEKTLMVLRNTPVESMCNHTSTQREMGDDTTDISEAIANIIVQCDGAFEAHQSFFRSRLALMQYHVRVNALNEQVSLVKGLNDLVSELNALIDILGLQIGILDRMVIHLRNRGHLCSRVAEQVAQRKDRRQDIERVLSQAKETQNLYFQLTSTETARRQAILADRMSQETHQQFRLAKKGDVRNRAILAFTIITIVFLPLSFFTSYFGMNTSDIRSLNRSQALYWEVAAPCVATIVLVAAAIANYTRTRRFLHRMFPNLCFRPPAPSDNQSDAESEEWDEGVYRKDRHEMGFEQRWEKTEKNA